VTRRALSPCSASTGPAFALEPPALEVHPVQRAVPYPPGRKDSPNRRRDSIGQISPLSAVLARISLAVAAREAAGELPHTTDGQLSMERNRVEEQLSCGGPDNPSGAVSRVRHRARPRLALVANGRTTSEGGQARRQCAETVSAEGPSGSLRPADARSHAFPSRWPLH